MSTHWNQNLLLFVTTMILILMRLPIGNGIKYSSIMTPTPLDDLTVAEDDTENYSNDINKVILNDDFNLNDDDLLHVSKRYLTNNYDKLRHKRQAKKLYRFTVEVMVAVDGTMVEFHKDDLKSYILTLFSMVSDLFVDASIGNSISVSVTNIIVLQDKELHAFRNSSWSYKKIRNFCNHISSLGYPYDTALLITRDVLVGAKKDYDYLGFSELASACKRKSCSLIKDDGLGAAITIAHELGHILGIPHDDEADCAGYNKSYDMLHIMTHKLNEAMSYWSWSNCSRHYLSQFLERRKARCLRNTGPPTYFRNHNNKLPGEIYSWQRQCQLIHGGWNKGQSCGDGDICRKLWCTDENSNCRNTSVPMADGTPCNESGFWCQKGACVPRSPRRVVHGGWGPWSEFTPCSLTCGGGVQVSRRECNNPVPLNGRYCKGQGKRYLSCNTQNCPPGSLDPRAQQCSNKNGQYIAIRGIDYRSAKWMPIYFKAAEKRTDKCQLHCYHEDNRIRFDLQFPESVIDGTPCSIDSFNKCVNGNCRRAGCDNKLHSTAKFDKCGICGGRNDTCKEYTHSFYVSGLKMQPESDYGYVATIPGGASNILITKRADHYKCHIALVDDQNEYLLNGNHVIRSTATIHYAGVTLEYDRGSSNVQQYVKSTKFARLKRDLVIEIIPVGEYRYWNSQTLLLTYSYTIDKMDTPKTIERKPARELNVS